MGFTSKKLNAFGLDISERSLKIAKLKKVNNSLQLVSFGKADIQQGVIDDSVVKNPEVLGDAIRNALSYVKGEKIKDKYVVVSLPEEKSFLDILRIPLVESHELAQAVSFEATNHIPMGLDDVYFDFEVIYKDAKFQDVLIAAVPKIVVDSYLDAITEAELKPIAMEIECLSVARSLIKGNTSKKPILIVDFGATRSSVMIFLGNSLRFTSTVPISSLSLTENIAKVFKITNEKADKLKQEEGLIGKKKVASTMFPVLSDLVRQITTHLSYYRSHTFRAYGLKSSQKVDKILLSGGAANLKGLPEFLAERLNMQVELGNPWVNILTGSLKEVPLLNFEESLGYSTALGLALLALKYQ